MCLVDLLRWGDEGPVVVLEPETSESTDRYDHKEKNRDKTLDESRFDDESWK